MEEINLNYKDEASLESGLEGLQREGKEPFTLLGFCEVHSLLLRRLLWE